jgi:hypothetical protein
MRATAGMKTNRVGVYNVFHSDTGSPTRRLSKKANHFHTAGAADRLLFSNVSNL